MKYAIAMYRASIVVSANDCDSYSTYKEWGLKCPFCDEPVFYRAASQYLKDGRSVQVSSAFVHFRGQKDESLCELRATRKEGQAYIARLRKESKAQRLSAYNEYLWEMFSEDRRVTTRDIRRLRKQSGRATADWIATSKRLLKEASRTDVLPELIEKGIEHSQVLPKVEVSQFSRAELSLYQDRERKVGYFTGVDSVLHAMICEEICRFLSTSQGAAALSNIAVANYGFLNLAGLLEGLTSERMIVHLVEMIVGTCWLEQLQKRV